MKKNVNEISVKSEKELRDLSQIMEKNKKTLAITHGYSSWY
jgi:hypothetical protein